MRQRLYTKKNDAAELSMLDDAIQTNFEEISRLRTIQRCGIQRKQLLVLRGPDVVSQLEICCPSIDQKDSDNRAGQYAKSSVALIPPGKLLQDPSLSPRDS